jgi:hypothetical protein
METILGNNYESVGSINTDLLLKTRGNIKVQVGNTFKDLLENEGDTSIIKTTDSEPSSSLSSGFYIYNNKLYLVHGETVLKFNPA